MPASISLIFSEKLIIRITVFYIFGSAFSVSVLSEIFFLSPIVVISLLMYFIELANAATGW